jgi:tetratricopeptide (TPR) repeat protein
MLSTSHLKGKTVSYLNSWLYGMSYISFPPSSQAGKISTIGSHAVRYNDGELLLYLEYPVHGGYTVRYQGFILFILLMCGIVQGGWRFPTSTAAPIQQSPMAKPHMGIIHDALQHALSLQFEAAIAHTTELEEAQRPTLASQLTRGMIAYFQSRWQTRQTPPAWQIGHEALAQVLEEGQKRLQQAQDDPWLKLLLGTAAVFDALLQQSETPWQSWKMLSQGRSWLQEALVLHEETTDAHLGLGLLYFAAAPLPTPLLPLLGSTGGTHTTSESIYHLQRAAEAGQFSQDVARTFLLQVYAEEKRYDDAIVLGQRLQASFPRNGYYALLTGRSQCAHQQYEQCATTLDTLAALRTDSPTALVSRDDRLDLYYTWGKALDKLGHYEQAFHAFRQAINQDPQGAQDQTLWAKYYLARLYERRGQDKTARQIYQTLLRGRNIEDLHEQAEQRLAEQR